MAKAQRKMVYAQRDGLLATDDVSETIADFRAEVVNTIINQFVPPESLKEQWDVKGLERVLVAELNEEMPSGLRKRTNGTKMRCESVFWPRLLLPTMLASIGWRMVSCSFAKHILLCVLDDQWKEYLSTMDHLRQGVHLRGYAAKKTKQEYRREAFERFS